MQVDNKSGNGTPNINAGSGEPWKRFISPAIFDKPAIFPVSAWTEHIPFAFWLATSLKPSLFAELGTHYGLSYFSFCQAIQKARLKTTCFAIDNWQGDEHAGFYDGSVFDFVCSINSRYSGFSTLCRMSFDEALPSFANQSIDLLHIDGLHTYEAVKHDFYNWLPKMSEKGVVIFHDTHVMDRGFGVHQLWAELKQQYPHFEFAHGFGLGVLGTGKNIPKKVSGLFDMAAVPASRYAIQKIYERMGLLCRLEQEHHHLSEKIIATEEKAIIPLAEEIKNDQEQTNTEKDILPGTANGVPPLEKISLQVFWKKAAEAFTEINSVSQHAVLADDAVHYTLPLRQHFSGIDSIRIDPGAEPGVLYLHSIDITNAEGQPLLNWDAIKNISTFHNLVILKSIFAKNAYVLVSLTGDPMIEINLPPLNPAAETSDMYAIIAVSKINDELLKQELYDISVAVLKAV